MTNHQFEDKNIGNLFFSKKVCSLQQDIRIIANYVDGLLLETKMKNSFLK